MYARFVEESEEEDKVTGRCFVNSGADKSPMTSKVRSLLESFEIPFCSYDPILSDFDNTLS